MINCVVFKYPPNQAKLIITLMKYCPICDARYDEEIIQFCTIDGTPLIEEEKPKFTVMPSESLGSPDDEIGEATVIRRKPASAEAYGSSETERIVIPTSIASEQQVRPRTAAAYYPPPQQNTAKTVALTILGTVFVLACGAGLFWFLQKEKPSNTNLNANIVLQNTNLNTNLGFDSNFNFNSSPNFNTNLNTTTNLNANFKLPTPTPKPKPSSSPTPTTGTSPSPSQTPRPAINANAVRPTPSPSTTPRTGPRPPTMTNRPPGIEN